MLAFLAIFAALSTAFASSSNCPMTHAQAVAYCASQGSNLVGVTSANLAALSAQAGYAPKWVGSWNGDNYNGACLVLSQGTVVVADCNAQNQAMCARSPAPGPCPPTPAPCPPAPQPCYESSSSSCSLPDPLPLPCESSSSSVYGPSSRSRSSRSSSSSSSNCYSSSSSSCDRPQFEYVYLTNTVTSSYTSVASSTSTVTSTNLIYFATVAAYTVTGGVPN